MDLSKRFTQAPDLLLCIVECERHADSCRESVVFHEWLCAVVSRADGNAGPVQEGCDVMGVDVID